MVNRALDPSRRRSKTVWLCLTPGEWEALVEMSRDIERSKSNILRDALRVYMVEHERRKRGSRQKGRKLRGLTRQAFRLIQQQHRTQHELGVL